MTTKQENARQTVKPLRSPLHVPQAPAFIYLDNHATTPLDPAVLDAMMPYMTTAFGNPASTHMYGVQAKFAVEQARQQVATALHADTEEIIFTSGATESNNFVIKGIFDHFKAKQPHFIVSNIEHKCILEAVQHIKTLGAEVTVLPVNKHGLVEPQALKAAIRPNTVLVSIMFANNEIGTINEIATLVKICHDNGILFHTDAAQAVGKVPIDVHSLGIDMLSASGHKFYGPKGIGFAFLNQSARKCLTSLLDGGGQEAKLRSGTLNVPGIVGIGKAIELATTDLQGAIAHYMTLRNRLYRQLLTAFPDMLLNGTAIETAVSASDIISGNETLRRLPHNLNVTLPSIDPSALSRIPSVAFSSTSACSSGKVEPSYVLLAIGRTPKEAQSSLRFGIGRFNTESDIDNAADKLIAALTA